MTFDEYIAGVIDSAKDVDVPEDIRAQHQPDPNRIEERSQCVCMCGASCVTYAGHLIEAAKHRELWDRLCAERGHPMEAFARRVIDPRGLVG